MAQRKTIRNIHMIVLVITMCFFHFFLRRQCIQRGLQHGFIAKHNGCALGTIQVNMLFFSVQQPLLNISSLHTVCTCLGISNLQLLSLASIGKIVKICPIQFVREVY